ncbi:MAG: response regulator transcription factor [Clostridiaceae bacterium]|nr:response regulator transcription factor [Clostridiaceae bacterium]
MKRAAVLIVEDDHDILSANSAALELEGYDVLSADTLAKGRSIAESISPDLIILDILLPDGNGLSYCEELRGNSGIRILFLSALNTRENILAGLRAGGDDYISKPYDMDELLLRVEALLRRGKLNGQEEPPMRLGELELDFTSHRALLCGADILLKPKEFALLAVLAREPGRVFSAAELYKKVWGMDMAGDKRTVKEHISRIRSKLCRESGFSVVSERGKGYRLQHYVPR